MSISLNTLRAFSDELEKISEAPKVEAALRKAVDTPEEFERTLKPGDVLFSAPNRKSLGYFWRYGYKPVSEAVQGTDYGHALLYSGDGQILEARIGGPVKEYSIQKLLRKNNVVAMRPDVTDQEKQEAIDYARKMKKAPFDVSAILRAALPLRGHREGQKPEESKGVICSALIANAYAKRKFSDSSRLYIRPSEIMESSIMKPVSGIERFNRG